MATRILTVNIRSDYYCQVKPCKLTELKHLVENGAKHSPCYLTTRGANANNYVNYQTFFKGDTPMPVWAVDQMTFTNLQVYDLLSKAVKIVENTEEYLTYQLTEIFESNNKKYTFTPPGTLRFFDQNLICFYTGKNWRGISL